MAEVDGSVQKSLDSLGISHKVLGCDPDFADTTAYCEKYNFPPEKCANTILVAGKDKSGSREIVACVVLATDRLDVNKKIRKLLGAKKASFANAEQTAELTGMKIGGVVIFGLPGTIKILVDQKVLEKDEVIMGGGNRSSKILINPTELEKLPNLKIADITQ